MRGLNKYIGGLAVVLGLFSCVEENKLEVKPFKDVLNFDQEVSNLSGTLQKEVIQGDGIESKTLNNPNFQVEMKPFIDANFNRMANKENYIRTEEISVLSGWRDVVWRSKNDKLPVKSAIYRFDGDSCISAKLFVVKESTVYNHTETLTYVKESGYSIENEQLINGLENEQFYLSGQFEGKPQPWRMFFDIGNNQKVPVNFDLISVDDKMEMIFHQGKERIKMPVAGTSNDYRVEIPIFQAYLTFTMDNDLMVGEFHNLDKGDDYIIPFTAMKLPYEAVVNYNLDESYPDFSGKWETYFGEGDEKSAAIGLIDRLGNDLVGTFATETGDYRFLQGKVIGNSFSLSTFDGSHLFLFTGKINGNEITEGHFYSGSHYHTVWSAKKNESFELLDPDKMTTLQEGVEKVDFTFPDLNGNSVSLGDAKFENKVVIIQILGSWCPNCMDETRYFKELYSKYNKDGLEIIGLAFERSNDFEVAKISLNKAIKDLAVPYTMLIAGTPKESAFALPMITKIKSYPTSIILDKKGNVVQIHTGFYGPSTGAYYEEYTQEMESLLENLLR